ncbi:MAG: hemerythrin domain-containing protein [Gemmatimonadetes bacterium]|nr:hemerythrin domain-containing protein [Gemmatimonadota bacterium]
MIGDALRRFEREHAEALAALARLEHAALALRGVGDPAPHFAAARDAHAFLEGPVKAHNLNEERALFPELGEDAPTAPFIDEHQTLWRLERELGAALRAADAERTADTALELAELLRAHIARENEILFPMARGLLGAEGLARVARRLGD